MMDEKASPFVLDSFDRNILRIMQCNNRTTSEQIAEKIGLSAAAVQRRIKKMRKNHIIMADVSIVNPQAANRPMTLIVQVTMERERMDLVDAFKRQMASNQEVQQCYYVTGSSDFILIMSAQSMEDYEQFTRRHFFDNTNVRSFQTSVVMDAVKVNLQLLL